MQEIIEKRLIIDKVVQSMQEGNNIPRLTIRSELEQLRAAKMSIEPQILASTMQ